MPKDLTDVSQWVTVSVPVGTDPRTAATVEDPCQDLADRTRYLLDQSLTIKAAPLLSWREADKSAITTFTLANVLAAAMRWQLTSRKTITLMDSEGETAISKAPGYSPLTHGGNGVLWEDEADTPNNSLTWVASATRAALATRYEQAANAERLAVSNSAAGQVAWSSAFDTWSNTAPAGATGVAWSACEYGDGIWVIGGAAGAIRTTDDPTPTTGNPFTARTSGLSGVVTRIRSNRKTGAEHRFLALDDAGDVSISTAGTTWSATTPSALTSTIEDIAWDALADRWVGIQYDGKRAYSDDGATWTESAAASLEYFTPSASNHFHIDADDQGNVLLTVYNGGSWSLFAVSPDSCETWREAHYENQYNIGRVSLMGPGRGIAAGAGGIMISGSIFATRGPG